MKISAKPVAVLVFFAVLIALWLAIRPAEASICFDRLGGTGPNSNTPRLDTLIDIPADQWPAAVRLFGEFASDNGWQVEQGSGDPDAGYRWLDMCNDTGTLVRASNEYGGEEGQIGFGVIHMTYEGPDSDGWQEPYRDLHRRIEAQWPGRLRYIEGEFGATIARPGWLDAEEVE